MGTWSENMRAFLCPSRAQFAEYYRSRWPCAWFALVNGVEGRPLSFFVWCANLSDRQTARHYYHTLRHTNVKPLTCCCNKVLCCFCKENASSVTIAVRICVRAGSDSFPRKPIQFLQLLPDNGLQQQQTSQHLPFPSAEPLYPCFVSDMADYFNGIGQFLLEAR